MAYDDDFLNFLTWNDLESIFQTFTGISENLTLGNVRSIIQSFGPVASHREVFDHLSLHQIERILADHSLSSLSLGSLVGMITAMRPLTHYQDAFSRLTLSELDNLLLDAGMQKVSIGALRDFVLQVRARAGEYVDIYRAVPLVDIERTLVDQGLDMPIGAVRNLIARVSLRGEYDDLREFPLRDDYSGARPAFSRWGDYGDRPVRALTIEDITQIFAVHGIDALSFPKLRTLMGRVQSALSGDYQDIFDVITATDLKSVFSESELQQLTFGDLGAVLETVRSAHYGDLFEGMTFAEFDRAFTSRGLRGLPVGELEVLMEEYHRYLEYEDAFEAVSWRQLDRTIESRKLGDLTVGDVARLFRTLRPLVEYEDLFENLSVADMRNLAAVGLDTFTLHDALMLPVFAAQQADYADVFHHLTLANLTRRLGTSGLKQMTVGQFRDALEKLRQVIRPVLS